MARRRERCHCKCRSAGCCRGLTSLTWGPPVCARDSQVNELKEEIYTPLPLGPGHAGDACVRLLHASGTVGCAAPTGELPTEGRLVRLEALRQPDEYPGAPPLSHGYHTALTDDGQA